MGLSIFVCIFMDVPITTLLTVKVDGVEAGPKKAPCIREILFDSPPQLFEMIQDGRYIMAAEGGKTVAYDSPGGNGSIYTDQGHLCRAV